MARLVCGFLSGPVSSLPSHEFGGNVQNHAEHKVS